MSQTMMLKTKEPIPKDLLKIATEYAEKLNLDPLKAEQMTLAEIIGVLLYIIEGYVQHQVHRQDNTFIIYAWNDILEQKYLIVHKGGFATGWIWK